MAFNVNQTGLFWEKLPVKRHIRKKVLKLQRMTHTPASWGQPLEPLLVTVVLRGRLTAFTTDTRVSGEASLLSTEILRTLQEGRSSSNYYFYSPEDIRLPRPVGGFSAPESCLSPRAVKPWWCGHSRRTALLLFPELAKFTLVSGPAAPRPGNSPLGLPCSLLTSLESLLKAPPQ